MFFNVTKYISLFYLVTLIFSSFSTILALDYVCVFHLHCLCLFSWLFCILFSSGHNFQQSLLFILFIDTAVYICTIVFYINIAYMYFHNFSRFYIFIFHSWYFSSFAPVIHVCNKSFSVLAVFLWSMFLYQYLSNLLYIFLYTFSLNSLYSFYQMLK